ARINDQTNAPTVRLRHPDRRPINRYTVAVSPNASRTNPVLKMLLSYGSLHGTVRIDVLSASISHHADHVASADTTPAAKSAINPQPMPSRVNCFVFNPRHTTTPKSSTVKISRPMLKRYV